MGRPGRERTGDRRLAVLLCAPAVALMVLVTAYPLAKAVALSLQRYRLTDPGNRAFVGLANYRTVLTDPLWWQDLGTTALLTVVSVTLELALGLALALVMHRVVRGRGLLRTALLIPYGIVTVVSAYAWRYAFSLDSGFVNGWLAVVSPAFSEVDWFGHRWSALLVIVASEVWKTTPFVSLLLLAGLVAIPREVQDAARVDGAGPWRRLTRVTLPCMKGALVVATLFRVLDAWRIFDNPYVMTSGANGTETLSFLAYRQTITLTNLGLGSAVAVLLFLSVVVIFLGLARVLRLDTSRVTGAGP